MKRIPSLDGLRAISIVMVMLGHLVKWKHVSIPVVHAYGALGVHVFFVLSGYLITNLLLEEHERSSSISLRNFYMRRAFRIFPAAFVFLAVVVGLYWREMSWTHVAAAVFYVANMDVTRPWIFGHLWSLSIEEQFYLLWPFTLKRLYRYRVAILICVFIATPVFRTLMYALKSRGALAGSLPSVADQLAIGCLLAIFAKRLPRIPAWVAFVMTLAAVLIPWYPATTPTRTVFMLFILRPLLHVSIAGIVLHVIQVPYIALNWGPVAWLGKISYSLYLWQELFCSNANLHYGYVLVLPAVGCACLSYYLVEQPMLRVRDRLSKKAGPQQPSREASVREDALAYESQEIAS
jgi:peptidoglycan/LPS O-acetylase OafA/YrhL